jgi:hypothetical protein
MRRNGQHPDMPHTRNDDTPGNDALRDMRAQLADLHERQGWRSPV